MVPREALRVHDMLEAIGAVEQILSRQGDAPALHRIEMLALQRAIEIFSEASRHLTPETKARHPSVPWRQIANIGNVLRHAYRDIDPGILHEVVRSDLPILKPVLQRIWHDFGLD